MGGAGRKPLNITQVCRQLDTHNIMGGVVIAPNIKKESIRIDLNGNEIDPKTKKIIKKKDQDYVPPTVVETPEPSGLAEMIKQKINDKMEKLIEEKIDEALKGL